jgi:hypothetical protein
MAAFCMVECAPFLVIHFFFSQALEGLLFTLFAVDEVARGLKFLMVPCGLFFRGALKLG